jgi:opacity protein-like surface antigen
LLSTHNVAAADGAGGFYIGIKATGTAAELNSVDGQGFTGSKSVQNDNDLTIGAGAVVGYRWADIPLRTEIEGGYRFRFDFDVQDSGPPVIDYDADVATTLLMVNLLLEWRNGSDFTPFAGGSVGWARHSSDATRTVTTTRASSSQTTHSDNLAWGAIAGVNWAFLDHWSAELAYRFADLGEVKTGSFAAGGSVSSDHYYAHDLMLSVIYRF